MGKKQTTQFSPMLWLQIKTLYISGKFSSLKNLHKYLKENQKGKIPSLRTLEKVKTREGWSKTAVKEQEEEILARTFSDRFEKAGLGDDAVVQKIFEGVNHATLMIAQAKEAIAAAYKDKDSEKIEAAIRQAQEAIKSHRVVLGYLQERNQLCGSYAANKIKIPGVQGIADDLKELHAMTDQELRDEILSKVEKITGVKIPRKKK